MPQLLENRWLAPLTAFLVAVAFAPGWAGAATSPRWAVIAVSAWFIPWFALPLLATMFWKLGIDLGAHWALLCGALAWGWRADSEILNRVALAFAAGLFVSVIAACAQHYLGWNGVPQLTAPAGLFVNKNVLAETAALAIVAMLAVNRYALAAALAPVLIWTEARAATLGVLAGVFCMLPRSTKFAVACAAPLALVLVLAYQVFDPTSLFVRFDLWREALGQMTLWGNGPYDYSTLTIREPNLHNDWFQRVYELGVIGFVPLAFLAAGCVADHRYSPVVVCCAVIACFSFPLAMPASGWFAAFVLGGVLGIAHERRGTFLRPRLANPFV